MPQRFALSIIADLGMLGEHDIEDDEIEKVVLEEMGLQAIPTAADDKRKYNNLAVQYNHTFF